MLDRVMLGVAGVMAAASFTGALAWYIVYWPEVKDVFRNIKR